MHGRILALAATFAIAACGASKDETQASRLTLVLDDGSEIPARAGETTWVQLLVVGSTGGAPSFAVAGAPPFVSLEADRLRIAPGRADGPATYELTVSVAAGGDTDAKRLRIAVARPNSPPAEFRFHLQDEREMVFHRATSPTPEPYPLIGPVLVATFYDLATERDPAWVEVEVIPDGSTFTGVATHRSPLLTAYSSDWGEKSLMYHQLALDGLEEGRAYRAAARAIDEALGMTPWKEEPIPFRPMPFVLPMQEELTTASGACFSSLCVSTRAATTYDFAVRGAPPGPVVLAGRRLLYPDAGGRWVSEALPPWATISGTTVTFAPPPEAIGGATLIELTATSGALSTSRLYHVWVRD